MSTFRLTLAALQGRFEKEANKLAPPLERAASRAMRETVKLAVDKGRQSILAAGFSQKWANALRGKQFPENQPSLKVAGYIYSKIGYAGIFEHGGNVLPKHAGLLWIPIENNVPTGQKWTPALWQTRIGPLAFVKRTGETPLLIGRVPVRDIKGISIPLHAAPIGLSPSTQKRRRRFATAPVVSAPVFFGVPLVHEEKKFHVTEARDAAAKRFGDFFSAALKTT